MDHDCEASPSLDKPPPAYGCQDDRITLLEEVGSLSDLEIQRLSYVPPSDRQLHHWNTIERALEGLLKLKSPSQSDYYVPRDTLPVTNPEDLFSQEWDLLAKHPTTYQDKDKLLQAYFTAINFDRDDLVERLLQSGLVDANTPGGPEVARMSTTHCMTPLLAAVMFHKRSIVEVLMNHGAHIDGWGLVPVSAIDTGRREWWRGKPTSRDHFVARTPLQLAATLGDLVMVKLLLEQYGADDSLVAPDGQLALRLAAKARHSNIVAYLPSRRGGAVLRLKEQWRVSFARIKYILKKFGRIAYVTFWDCPKTLLVHCIILPIKRGVLWCWRNKQYFGPWCGKMVRGLGANVVKGVKWIGKGIRAFPGKAWRFLRDLPGKAWQFLRDIYQEVARVVKRIPKACRYVGRFLRSSCITIIEYLKHIAFRTAAFFHTAVSAIYQFFRHLTLIDLWNGICDILRAVFISFPKALKSILRNAWDTFGDVLIALFGHFGCLVFLFLTIPVECAKWLGQQMWRMLTAFGSILGSITNEIRVWWNPKAC